MGPLGSATKEFGATFLEPSSETKFETQIGVRDHLSDLFVIQFAVQVALIVFNWMAFSNQHHPENAKGAKSD